MSFDICDRFHLFPPHDILNAFLLSGIDSIAGEQVQEWRPFELNEKEYAELWAWWKSRHPLCITDRLAVQDADYSEWFARAVIKMESAMRVGRILAIVGSVLGLAATLWVLWPTE